MIPFLDEGARKNGGHVRFSEHGDSGAAVLSYDGKLMGQVVSGGPAGCGDYVAMGLKNER